MYIVAIAWMYVVVLMAATQPTLLSGLGTLVFYGVIPCWVVMYIVMAPTRARRKKALKQSEQRVIQAKSVPPMLQIDP
jgi:SNF family Na+-dependent transporter